MSGRRYEAGRADEHKVTRYFGVTFEALHIHITSTYQLISHNHNETDNGCVHNQQSDQSDESDLLKFVHNQIQICSDASEKNLTSRTDFYKPCP